MILQSNKRLFELDCLRGIAALSVVLFHLTFSYENARNFHDPSKFYFYYGRLGVQLFFIISGFVIFMTLSKTENIFNFIISRFSRLYPAYWVCIIFTVITTTLFSRPVHFYTFKQIFFNFTMFQSAFFIKDIDGAYWTLFVELTFYLVMGVIFKLNQLKNIQIICFGWLILSLLFYFFDIPFDKYIKVLLLLRYAPLFISGIGYYLMYRNNKIDFLYLIIFSFFTYLIIWQEDKIFPPKFFDILVLFIINIILFFLVKGKLKFLICKPIQLLGNISYPLYLLHANLGYCIMYWLKKIIDIQIFYLPIAILSVIILAYFIHIYVEKPSLNKIRSYFLKGSN